MVVIFTSRLVDFSLILADLVFMLTSTIAAPVLSAQSSCLWAADRNSPAFDSAGDEFLTSGTQAIITTYKFRGSVNITKWETYVDPPRKKGVYMINFQVWRLNGEPRHGCYSWVGSNIFTGSLKKKGRVEFVVEPSNYITAETGDVVGLYVSSTTGGQDGVRLHRSTQAEDIVWYHTTSAGNSLLWVSSACPVLVGPDGVLINRTSAAPMLRVSTGKL